MNSSRAVMSILATTVFLLTACGEGDTGSGAATDAGSLTVVKVAAVQGGVMPVDFRAGVQEGIFARHGLDVQIDTLATGLDDISAAVQGSADIGYSDIFGGAAARGNGFDVGLVAPHNGNNSYNYFLVPDGSPLQILGDLKDKTVAIGAPPLFRTLASTALSNAGVDPAQVNFTIVKDQTTFGVLLKTGQVDAASITSVVNAEKWIAEEGFRPLVEPSAAGQGLAMDVPIAGWWATSAWFNENQHTAEAFAAALTDTQDWFGTLSPEKQAVYVKEQTGVDAIELEQTVPGLLDKLTVGSYNPQAGVVDEMRLTEWLANGQKYAQVPDIPLDELLLPTARAGGR